MTTGDAVNHPPHYNSHPSGVECIDVVQHMGFNVGNAVKYLWRVGLKTVDPIQDLRKAAWYIEQELRLRAPAHAHAGLSLPCEICRGRCRIDDPKPAADTSWVRLGQALDRPNVHGSPR